MKNLLYEKVSDTRAYEDVPETVAFVEVKKDATTAEVGDCVHEDQHITDAWWNNEGVTKMFVVPHVEHNDR